jgi:copper(I)-binding protein
MKRAMFLFLVLWVTAGCATSGGNAGEIEIENVWGRSSPMVAQNGAFYMIVTNNTGEDDELLAAKTDACGTVELHEMYMKENDVMGMRQVPGGTIPVPAGETVELKVGGLHVMCIGKQAAFEVGDKIPISLEFANAGDIEVTADIRESEMGGMDMEHEMGEDG